MFMFSIIFVVFGNGFETIVLMFVFCLRFSFLEHLFKSNLGKTNPGLKAPIYPFHINVNSYDQHTLTQTKPALDHDDGVGLICAW